MTKNEAAADALKKAEAERQAKRRGAARLNKAMRKALAGMTPPDDLTVTQWAEAKRRLSAESAAEPGPWRTERTPYLREPMDAFTDPKVRHIVMVAASQVGKSEFLNNCIGYIIDEDPGSILFIHPTTIDAQEYSKLRIAPMLRDSPALRQKIAAPKSRDSHNTILQKAYPGGIHEAAVGVASAEVGRCGNAVCFNDVQPHRIGIQRRRRVTLHQDKHVSGHEPRFERELLQRHEVVQAERVAVLLFTAPEPKFHLGFVLPLFCRLRRKPQQVAVDGRFQRQACADNLCAVGVDGARGHGRRHIKHSRPLAQRGVVAVNIFVWRTAVWGEPFERAPGDARTSFAIALGIRSSAPAVISLAQCFRLL
jgi:hypothetical protein